MGSMSLLSPEFFSVIDQIPACVKNTTLVAIATNRCEADVACLCRNDEFLSKLVRAILRSCGKADQQTAMGIAQGVCSVALPSLNDSQQAKIIAIVVVMMCASTLAVLLRLVARYLSTARYGYDDLFIVIALVLTYGLNVNELIGVHFGFGKHQIMLSLYEINRFLLNDLVTQLIFSFAITATRLSLLFFYHRIFPSRRFAIYVRVLGGFVVAWWLCFCIAIICSCIPVRGFWDRSVPSKCINEHSISYSVTGTELLTNVAMLILPIPWLWKLYLPRSKKFALFGIFMLGSFVCVACVVRFPVLSHLRVTDTSWTIVPLGMWVVVECNMGIASVCLPIMRPLFTKHVSHPVRSRFSAFPFTGNTKEVERSDDDGDTMGNSSNAQTLVSRTLISKNLKSKALTSGSSKTPQPTNDSMTGNDDVTHDWRPEGWQPDIIRPVPAEAHAHYSIGTPEYPAKHCRRKEHWEIVEEREREEEEERVRKQKMDPSKWQQRKQQWERIERMSSKGRSDRKKSLPPETPPSASPPSTSWYNGWGNRMGHGDGNQGWELELGPLAGGVEFPPMTEPGGSHAGRSLHGDAAAFGKF